MTPEESTRLMRLESMLEGQWDTRLKARQKAFRLGVKSIEVFGSAFQMRGRSYFMEEKASEGHHRTVVLRGNLLVMTVPVTQALYEALMFRNPSAQKGLQHPVTNVSWRDALEFANALSVRCGLETVYYAQKGFTGQTACDWDRNGWRLPTEAEWAYLAKADGETNYSGSDDIDAVAWYQDNSGATLQPVGQKQANDFGLYDMSGNVWEWCWDFGGSKPYSGVVEDPNGPSHGMYRVIRGGSYLYGEAHSQVSSRHYSSTEKGDDIGFRLVRRL